MPNSGNFNKPEGRNKMKVKKVEPALSRLQDFPRNPYVFIWYITKGFRRWYVVEVLLSFLQRKAPQKFLLRCPPSPAARSPTLKSQCPTVSG